MSWDGSPNSESPNIWQDLTVHGYNWIVEDRKEEDE
jgi:hypothetical protein